MTELQQFNRGQLILGLALINPPACCDDPPWRAGKRLLGVFINKETGILVKILKVGVSSQHPEGLYETKVRKKCET